jgi:hypothetical protein
MPTHDAVPRLIQSVRGSSTAAPLELFIQIRDAISALVQGRSLVRPGIPPRTHVDAAYQNMVPIEARTRANHAAFLSIASTAVRHLLTCEAKTQLRNHSARLPATSLEVIESMIREGHLLEPRHLKALLVLDDALNALESHHALQAQIVEGHLYGQMNEDVLAVAHDVSVDVVRREVVHGMAWLHRHGMPSRPILDRLRPPMMRL